MARKKIIAGNWKMNMTPSEAVALVNELKPLVANDEVDVVFCVPAIDIIPAMEAAKGNPLRFAVFLRLLRLFFFFLSFSSMGTWRSSLSSSSSLLSSSMISFISVTRLSVKDRNGIPKPDLRPH